MKREHEVTQAMLLRTGAARDFGAGLLARQVFGGEYMKTVSDRVHALLLDWGYNKHGMSDHITILMTELTGEMG